MHRFRTDRRQEGPREFLGTTETWEHISQVAIERHQVLFEAFTPAEDARIAVIVALEAGRAGGRDAAPIARTMLDAWLLGEPAPPPVVAGGSGEGS